MRRNRGFTFVEALIAGGLFCVVLGTLFLAFFAGADTVRRGMEVLDVSTTAGLFFEHLKRDLRALAGEVPLPSFSSPGELVLEFARLESLDAGAGSGRTLAVRYHLVTAADRSRTLITRDADGGRARFFFEREVGLLVSSADGVAPGERAIAVQLSFPSQPGRSARPPVETVIRVLNRDALAGAQGAPGTVVVPLPRGDRPFAAGATVRTTDAAAVFPPWAWPAGGQGQ